MAIRISEHLWFEVYALQDYTESPFRNYLEGGLSYPGRTFKGVFNMSESTEEAQEFQGNVMVQLQTDQRVECRFVIANSQRFSGFFISSVIKTTDSEPIAFQACGYILTYVEGWWVFLNIFLIYPIFYLSQWLSGLSGHRFDSRTSFLNTSYTRV